MSIVSPVVACGAVVPFGISIATGERPSSLALAGAALAIGGAVLASAEERRAAVPHRTRAVALAVAAAVALGLFTYFLGLGSREGSALSTLTGARVGSLGFLLVLAAGRRESLRVGRRWIAPAGRDRPVRHDRQRAVRARKPARTARPRLRARLALPDRHDRARLRRSSTSG